MTDLDALRSENLRLRDKLLELAKECCECDGTGVVTVRRRDRAEGLQVPCRNCEDIREVLA